MPDWKKEIKVSDLLGRKSRGAGDSPPARPAGDEQGWRQDQHEVVPDATAGEPIAVGSAEEPERASETAATPVWKKEIKAGDVFKRRGRGKAVGGPPEEGASGPEATGDRAASVWKRELHAADMFRKRERAPKVPTDALSGPAGENVRFWKKDVKLSDLVRKTEAGLDPEQPAKALGGDGKRRLPFSRAGSSPSPGRGKSKDAIPAPVAVPLLRSVNLLPADAVEEKARKITPGQIVVGAAAVAVIAALVVGVMRESATIGELETRKAELATQIQQVQQQAAPPVASPTGEPLAGEEASRVAALAEALGTRTAWDRVLRGTALVMPEGTWLKQVSGSSQPADPTVPGGASVSALTLLGYSLEQDGVARLLSRLRTLPEVASVQLGAASLAEVGSEDVYEFSITVALRSSVLEAAAQQAATPLAEVPASPAPAAEPADPTGQEITP